MAVCAFWRVRAAGQPSKWNTFNIHVTNIHQVDRLETIPKQKHSQAPETRWLTRKTKYIYIYLYTFLLRVLMICFCRLPTSWDIRVRHVILHIKHLAVSGHCTYGPTNHCYFGCTLNLMHQVDAGNTPTFRVLWLVPVAPQGWVPLYLPQFLLILIDKFADGIKHVRSNTSQVYNIYIYLCMQVWFPSSCGSDKIQQLATWYGK